MLHTQHKIIALRLKEPHNSFSEHTPTSMHRWVPVAYEFYDDKFLQGQNQKHHFKLMAAAIYPVAIEPELGAGSTLLQGQ